MRTVIEEGDQVEGRKYWGVAGMNGTVRRGMKKTEGGAVQRAEMGRTRGRREIEQSVAHSETRRVEQ